MIPLYNRGDARAPPPRASVAYKLGMLHRTLGHGDAAMAGYETAREIVRRLVDERPKDSKALRLGADIDSEMVHYFFDQRNPSGVLEASQEAENMVRRIVALNPSSVEARDYLSMAQSNLGEAYFATRELDLAAKSFRVAAETRE